MRLVEPTIGQERIRRAVLFVLTTIALCAVLALVCWQAFQSQRCAVTVMAWDREVSLYTHAATVAEALEEANISLAAGDICDVDLDALITEGLIVTVERAEPRFVHYAGEIIPVFTTDKSVLTVLALAHVTPGTDDMVIPDIDAELAEGQSVRVVKVDYEEVWEEIAVAFGTETRPDASIEAGLTKVYRQGVSGIERVQYRVRLEDGQEVGRDELTRDTVKEAVNKVVLTGTMTAMSRGAEDIRFTRAFEVKATAYCPCQECCGVYANGLTHTGLPAKKGVIAVDPNLIPLGTRVYVDGYGYATAADTGGAIKGNRIDVCYDTHGEALGWGVRQVKVYVLE